MVVLLAAAHFGPGLSPQLARHGCRIVPSGHPLKRYLNRLLANKMLGFGLALRARTLSQVAILLNAAALIRFMRLSRKPSLIFCPVRFDEIFEELVTEDNRSV
jgi:hypothetical protein